ncbi:Transcription factor SFL1 [Candida tropicalis]
MQQSPQEYIARPSIPAHPSYENATNFKLLELTNQINLLRNDFFHMNTRYETLQNELKCQIADSISVLDIVEGLSKNDNRMISDQLQHPAFRSRAESTYSPLSNVGKSNNQQQPAKPPTPINPPRIKTPVSEVKKQQQQQQQQVQAPPPPPPPPSTKQPVVPTVVQQKPSQVQTSRTNSLPNPITDHLAPQSPYFIQRNSFTSIYEHQKSLRIPSPRFNTTTPPRSVPENKESLSSMAKETKETVVSTSALPSVSELDKSIRSSVSLPPIIQHKDEREGNSNYNNDDNDTNKRRKLE